MGKKGKYIYEERRSHVYVKADAMTAPAYFPTYLVPKTRSKVNSDENMKVVASIESGTEELVDRGTLYLDRGY